MRTPIPSARTSDAARFSFIISSASWAVSRACPRVSRHWRVAILLVEAAKLLK